MDSKILFIGLDVDDKNFHGYAIFDGEERGTAFRSKPNIGALMKAVEQLLGPGVSAHFCYESTYCGFHLCRSIQKLGHECTIIAAGLIPEMASNRLKNDRLDAEKLARYFSKGLLTAVHIPDIDDEQYRMLVRSRSFLREELKTLKRHMISISKQLGISYREENGERASYWTTTHRAWLKAKVRESSSVVQKNFEILFSQLDSIEARLDEYAVEIRKASELPKYSSKVKSLVCYRGIDILTAMVFITELGDIKRFPHPTKLISYVGLDITEYSSGGKERRFSMTKMGNKHVRKMLVEAAQTANRPPILSRELKIRREGIDLKYIDVADRCMKRLNKKAVHLLFKGKPVNKIKAACAREMLGFVWESLNLAC